MSPAEIVTSLVAAAGTISLTMTFVGWLANGIKDLTQ